MDGIGWWKATRRSTATVAHAERGDHRHRPTREHDQHVQDDRRDDRRLDEARHRPARHRAQDRGPREIRAGGILAVTHRPRDQQRLTVRGGGLTHAEQPIRQHQRNNLSGMSANGREYTPSRRPRSPAGNPVARRSPPCGPRRPLSLDRTGPNAYPVSVAAPRTAGPPPGSGGRSTTFTCTPWVQVGGTAVRIRPKRRNVRPVAGVPPGHRRLASAGARGGIVGTARPSVADPRRVHRAALRRTQAHHRMDHGVRCRHARRGGGVRAECPGVSRSRRANDRRLARGGRGHVLRR